MNIQDNIQYYHMMQMAEYLVPVVIAVIAAIFLPRKHMRLWLLAAFFIIILVYGVIRPVRVMNGVFMLYFDMSGSGFMGLWSDERFVHAFINVIVLSLVNALIRACAAVVCMLPVFGIKSFFKRKE